MGLSVLYIDSWLAGVSVPFTPCADAHLISQFESFPEVRTLTREEILEGLSDGEPLDRHTIMKIVAAYLSHGPLDSVFLEKIYASKVLYLSEHENNEHIITHSIIRACGEKALVYLMSPLLTHKIIKSFNYELISIMKPGEMQIKFLHRLIELRPTHELMNIAKDIYSLSMLALITPISKRLSFLTSLEMSPHVIRLMSDDENKYKIYSVTRMLELLPKQEHAEFCRVFDMEKNINSEERVQIERCRSDLHQDCNMIIPRGVREYSYSLLREEIPNILNGTCMLSLNEFPDEIFLSIFNLLELNKNGALFQSKEFQERMSRIEWSSGCISSALDIIQPEKQLAFLLHELVQPIFSKSEEGGNFDAIDEEFALFVRVLRSLPEAHWDAFFQIKGCLDPLSDIIKNSELTNVDKLEYIEELCETMFVQFMLSTAMKPYLDALFDTERAFTVFLRLTPNDKCWALITENQVIQDKYSHFVSKGDPSLLFLRLLVDLQAGTFEQRKKVLELTENAYQDSPRNEGQYQRFHFFHPLPLDHDLRFIETLRESVYIKSEELNRI
jgi:hypothetical protein